MEIIKYDKLIINIFIYLYYYKTAKMNKKTNHQQKLEDI